MRVLHLASSFPRHEGDPVGTFLLDLAAAQADAGLEVHVLAPHDLGVARHAVMRGVDVHRFRYAPQRFERLAYRGGILAGARTPAGAPLVPPFLAAFVLAARRCARLVRPDVVHAHWWLPGGLAGAPITGPRFVITLHGTDVALLRNRALRALARRVTAPAVAVAAVSQPLADEAAAALGREVVVARMPVDVGDVPPRPRPPHPPLRLLTVGRHVREKGIDVVLDAVAGLGGVELDVVGDGPELAAHQTRAIGAAAVIRFHPPMPKAALLDLIDRAHAVVVPSRREGLGLVALEAMARARPVIATRVGGLTEVVVDGVDGLLVPPDDPAALATAIRRLPLPAPAGAALAAHRPAAVVAAHLFLYGAPA
ncbi:MAG: glycosyl transferase group 1 [Acidimicrobiales bacterium]|jgi:glycosyltransferase involved in cell wall biosynthesis|nr:glycosyl transferase group 1 [Acidimicrobiales bacterium]